MKTAHAQLTEALTQKIWLSGNPEPPEGESDLHTHPPRWFTSEPPHQAAELYGLERAGRLDYGASGIVTLNVTVLDTHGFRREFRVKVKRFTDYSSQVSEQAIPTTHILRFGRALCGRQGVPDNWPPGHSWVAFNSPEDLPKASCQECLAKKDEP